MLFVAAFEVAQSLPKIGQLPGQTLFLELVGLNHRRQCGLTLLKKEQLMQRLLKMSRLVRHACTMNRREAAGGNPHGEASTPGKLPHPFCDVRVFPLWRDLTWNSIGITCRKRLAACRSADSAERIPYSVRVCGGVSSGFASAIFVRLRPISPSASTSV